MIPALEVAALWVLFFGSHVVLGLDAVRARLSVRAHLATYIGVAWTTFTALCVGYAELRFRGSPGLALASHPVRPALFAAAVLGMSMIVAGALGYPRAPMRVLRTATPGPVGLSRITRHPVFVGIVLWAGAHALLATHLSGTVFFAGLAIQSALGGWLQDRKLLRRRGEPYREYLSTTSAIPFIAVLTGRQTLVPRELPIVLLGLALGTAVSWALRRFHGDLLAWHGVGVALSVIVGSSAISLGALRREAPK